MKLNLGSGEQLLAEYVNYDCVSITKNGKSTDVVDKIQNLTEHWKQDTFDTIIAYHCLEHITRPEVLQALKDCYSLLKTGGNLIVEGPDVVRAYDWYVRKNNNVPGYIHCIFGEDFNSRKKYGESWEHKSGWTDTIMAAAMASVGFKINHMGAGLSHGMAARDFRVEGIKQ